MALELGQQFPRAHRDGGAFIFDYRFRLTLTEGSEPNFRGFTHMEDIGLYMIRGTEMFTQLKEEKKFSDFMVNNTEMSPIRDQYDRFSDDIIQLFSGEELTSLWKGTINETIVPGGLGDELRGLRHNLADFGEDLARRKSQIDQKLKSFGIGKMVVFVILIILTVGSGIWAFEHYKKKGMWMEKLAGVVGANFALWTLFMTLFPAWLDKMNKQSEFYFSVCNVVKAWLGGVDFMLNSVQHPVGGVGVVIEEVEDEDPTQQLVAHVYGT